MNDLTEKLKNAVVGIAGLGGLGSTVAIALCRTGIGSLIIADFDKVEQSNLNRQHYSINQIGKYKVDAMIENLRSINPQVKVTAHKIKLIPENISQIFADADVIAECFDKADQKQVIVETVLTKMKDTPIVTASGLAGFGNSNAIQTKKISKRLILVGDSKSGTDSTKLLTAGRVWIAASHQANAIIELLMEKL